MRNVNVHLVNILLHDLLAHTCQWLSLAQS